MKRFHRSPRATAAAFLMVCVTGLFATSSSAQLTYKATKIPTLTSEQQEILGH